VKSTIPLADVVQMSDNLGSKGISAHLNRLFTTWVAPPPLPDIQLLSIYFQLRPKITKNNAAELDLIAHLLTQDDDTTFDWSKLRYYGGSNGLCVNRAIWFFQLLIKCLVPRRVLVKAKH